MTLNLDNRKNSKSAPLPITPKQAELIFWLLAREVSFIGTYDDDEKDWTNHWYAAVNVNDTFYYATADAESLGPGSLESLKYYFEKYSWDGVTAWASFQREGLPPIERLRTEKYYAAMKELKDKYAEEQLKLTNLEINLLGLQ